MGRSTGNERTKQPTCEPTRSIWEVMVLRGGSRLTLDSGVVSLFYYHVGRMQAMTRSTAVSPSGSYKHLDQIFIRTLSNGLGLVLFHKVVVSLKTRTGRWSSAWLWVVSDSLVLRPCLFSSESLFVTFFVYFLFPIVLVFDSCCSFPLLTCAGNLDF